MSSAAVRFLFNGKTALETGAGQGIGRTIAKALAASEAMVYGLSKTQSNLDSLVAECPSIRPVCVDLSDWNRTKKAVEDIGPVDLLVNNAGVYTVHPFLDVDPPNFDRVFNLNVRSIIAVSQVVAKGMIQRQCPGAIVNVSSIASSRGYQGYTVYGSSKAALDQLTRVMAVELGPHKIRVNSVNPTVVPTTPAAQAAIAQIPTIVEAVLLRTPLGALPGEEDISDAVLFLLSDNASKINGVTLPVDGGFLA